VKFIEIQGVKMLVENDRICISVLGILDKTKQGPLPFEPQTLPVWEDLCSAEGARVIDVGAYSGLYSLVARKAGARVTAFEPLERNRQRFLENAKLNGFDDLTVNAEAVSDKVGTATITTNLKAQGLSSGSSIVKVVGANHIPVPTVSIDSLGLKKLTAIKIDVERAEPLVLRGARETLERCRPTIIVEVLGPDEAAAVKASITGYEVEKVLDKRNWVMVPC
jgi:FkbM family methyltransferase